MKPKQKREDNKSAYRIAVRRGQYASVHDFLAGKARPTIAPFDVSWSPDPDDRFSIEGRRPASPRLDQLDVWGRKK